MDKTTKLAFSLVEAEAASSISQHTFRKLVRSGKVRAVRVGRRLLIPAAELEKLLKVGTPNSGK